MLLIQLKTLKVVKKYIPNIDSVNRLYDYLLNEYKHFKTMINKYDLNINNFKIFVTNELFAHYNTIDKIINSNPHLDQIKQYDNIINYLTNKIFIAIAEHLIINNEVEDIHIIN